MNTFKKRIDELGRIVIPKEIRKIYKINNFDELDLSVDEDKIIITKSIGLELYKEKIKKFLSLINNICNFNIIILNDDKIIESTYDNLNGKITIDYNENLNNVNKKFIVGNIEISGYTYLDKIIIDSNFLGYVVFINKDKFDNINLLKNIKNILIDLIN